MPNRVRATAPGHCGAWQRRGPRRQIPVPGAKVSEIQRLARGPLDARVRLLPARPSRAGGPADLDRCALGRARSCALRAGHGFKPSGQWTSLAMPCFEARRAVDIA